jgi:hypothetical protein
MTAFSCAPLFLIAVCTALRRRRHLSSGTSRAGVPTIPFAGPVPIPTDAAQRHVLRRNSGASAVNSPGPQLRLSRAGTRPAPRPNHGRRGAALSSYDQRGNFVREIRPATLLMRGHSRTAGRIRQAGQHLGRVTRVTTVGHQSFNPAGGGRGNGVFRTKGRGVPLLTRRRTTRVDTCRTCQSRAVVRREGFPPTTPAQ